MDIEKAVYSFLPLILIIVVSWVLSLLGSKMKKSGQNEGVTLKRGPAESPMDILVEKPSEQVRTIPTIPRDSEDFEPGPVFRPDSSEWGMDKAPQSPPVTPKPIKPKWWGA
jgi:hypothetical protein